jgi:hypothetical protein
MSGATRPPRLATALLRLYPRAWRERYGGELLAWTEEGGLGPLRALDLARGALDARLHPEVLEEGVIRMRERLRRSVLGVLGGYAIFVVAGFGYQKLTEYEDFTDAARQHAALGVAFRAVVVAALVALAAVAVAGAPIALAMVRQALAGRRELRWPLALVTLALLWLGGGVVALALRAGSSPAPAPMTGTGGLLLWSANFILPAALGCGAAMVAVRRTELAVPVLRFASLAVAVAAAAMLVMLIATVVWGVVLRSAEPALFHADEGLRATSTAASWVAIVVLMAAATALAVGSTARGLTGGSRRQPEDAGQAG